MSEVTLDQMIGARIRALRLTARPPMRQEDLQRALRSVAGIKWTSAQVSYSETGKRSVSPEELFALSLFFDVPIELFFTPTPELLDATVKLGDETFAASEFVTHRLGREGDPYWSRLGTAYGLVAETVREKGHLTEGGTKIRNKMVDAGRDIPDDEVAMFETLSPPSRMARAPRS